MTPISRCHTYEPVFVIDDEAKMGEFTTRLVELMKTAARRTNLRLHTIYLSFDRLDSFLFSMGHELEQVPYSVFGVALKSYASTLWGITQVLPERDPMFQMMKSAGYSWAIGECEDGGYIFGAF